MALIMVAGGFTLPVYINDSMIYEERVDQRATCNFTVMDSSSTPLSQLMVVTVTDDSTATLLYTGFIDNIVDTKLDGIATVQRVITCLDLRYLVDKRYWIGAEFSNWTAGMIAAELHRVVLSSEGVTAAYALRHDNSTATFGAGTLTGTAASNNSLALALSGTDFTQAETTTANFNTGTLTNVIGVNSGLSLVSYNAIKYVGSVGANLSNNNTFSAYRKIWGGSFGLTLNDLIKVDVWISSTSPEIKASIDILFSDGSWLSDSTTSSQDQYNITMDAPRDLKGWADDQWMHRSSPVISPNAGKTAVGVYLVFGGNNAGTYTAYFKNIKITDSTGVTTKLAIFTGSTMQSNIASSTTGYYGLSAKVTTVHEGNGVRIAPSRSITTVGIVKGSIISWVEIDGIQPTGGNSSSTYPQQVIVETSFDGGATYQRCTNHSPIPLLPVALSASGRAILVRQTLNVGGPSPEPSPFLDTVSFTIFSAPAATKADVADIDVSQTDFAAGSLTNCTANSDGLYTTGSYRNWDDLSVASQTVTGTGTSNLQGEAQKSFTIRTDANSEVKSQFSFAGTWTNFVMEVDVQIVDAIGNFGVVYRTTSWINTQNTYAYNVFLNTTGITLGKGSNGTTNVFTSIASTGLSLVVGTWYRLKLIINGSSHQFYLNDTLFLSATDSTFTGAGSVGVKYYSAGITGRMSSYYDNFSIIGYTASGVSTCVRTTAGLLMTPVGTVGSSLLNWTTDPIDDGGQLVVESTIDGGTTWNTCTNGSPIPLLVAGFNASGKTLKIRTTMTNGNVNLPIKLTGLAMWVIGQYSASGTRISPALDCTPAINAGASALTWAATAPTGSSVALATSLTGIGSWTTIGASGNPVAGITAQGAMTADDYITNTAANYTASFFTGGVLPVFSVDTANSKINITSGTNGFVTWNTAQFPTTADTYVEMITNQCGKGGLCWRFTSVDNCYYAILRDASAASNPNTLEIHKRVAAVDTIILAITTLPVTFTRGTYHTLKITMAGTLITPLWDGLSVGVAFTDTGLSAAGQVGYYQNTGAVTTQACSIRAQALGQATSGVNLYTRATLTSTDPTINPVVSDIGLAVLGTDIGAGIVIPATSYGYKKTCGAILDDVSTQSNYSWRVRKTNKALAMRDRGAIGAAWPLYSADPTFLGPLLPPVLTRSSPLYRNRQYVTGAFATQVVVEKKVGDGTAQSWALSYPIQSISSITLDGDSQTVGIAGSGSYYTYTVGQSTFAQDPAQVPPTNAQTQIITYVGTVPYTAIANNVPQQTALAAIDGSSGIYEASEDCGGLPAAAADAIAAARLTQYAILSREWVYATTRSGLSAGTIQTIFVPEHSMNDMDALITGIKTTITEIIKSDGTPDLQYEYDVSVAEGPNIGTWQRIFADALQ